MRQGLSLEWFFRLHQLQPKTQPSLYKFADPQQRIIQMDKLLNALLKQQLKKQQMNHAFVQMKNYNRIPPLSLSFRDKQAFATKYQSNPSIELQNKEEYLKYMEAVLLSKEEELGELEESLRKKRKQQEREEARTNIIQPLTLTHQSDALNKKIKVFKEIMLKYVKKVPELALDNDFEELIEGLQVVEISCKKNYDQLKSSLLKNHQELSVQRQQLTETITKLKELETYEKYLNEFQKILENKEYQLIEKGKQLEGLETALKVSARTQPIPYQPNLMQYTTFQEENTISGESQKSIRKRRCIFEQKAPVNKDQLHKESSKIMDEITVEHTVAPVTPDSYTTTLDSEIEKQEKEMRSFGIQTISTDQRVETTARINCESYYLKFLKKWFKYSANSKKATPQHSAIMYLYQWRANSLYDERIEESAKEILSWPKRVESIGSLPFENYGQLSLRKQIYLQNFFDFELRKFHKKKVQALLSSILKNKNRKERLMVFLTFRKYREMAKNQNVSLERSESSYQEYPLRDVTSHNSQVLQKNIKGSQLNKESRLLSNSCAFQEAPSRVSSSKSKVYKKNGTQASQIKQKSFGKESNVDLNKLKEYIKAQEVTEAKLATQCAQIQSVFRLANVLKKKTNSLQQKFMIGLARWDDNNRVDSLLQVVSSYQFKWELFMAKARLALTSNSNKVAHLQQLVSFLQK